MQYFLLILSILIYIIAPNAYDYWYCVIIFTVFLLSFFILLKERKYTNTENYFSFVLLFSISFLFVNFIYPVFIYPIDKGYFPVFDRYYFNEDVITKSTALALVGFNSFLVGNFARRKELKAIKTKRITLKAFNDPIFKSSYSVLLLLSTVLIVYVILEGYDGIIGRRTDTFHEFNQTILLFVQCTINLTIILCFLLKRRISNLLFIFIYAAVFIYIGDRGPALQTILVFLFSYSLLKKPFSKRQIAFIILTGFFILTTISSIRSREGGKINFQEIQIEGSLDFAMDLIVNNRNLYAGYEYADINGYSYGQSSIYYLFAPIPFLPSFITQTLFNKAPQELSSSTILTENVEAGYGLGTNLIADLYMQFGELGVLIMMFLLGYFIRSMEERSVDSFSYLLVYISICSFSIYMARSSMFDSVRYIVWSFFLFYLLYYFFYPYAKKNFSNK